MKFVQQRRASAAPWTRGQEGRTYQSRHFVHQLSLLLPAIIKQSTTLQERHRQSRLRHNQHIGRQFNSLELSCIDIEIYIACVAGG